MIWHSWESILTSRPIRSHLADNWMTDCMTWRLVTAVTVGLLCNDIIRHVSNDMYLYMKYHRLSLNLLIMSHTIYDVSTNRRMARARSEDYVSININRCHHLSIFTRSETIKAHSRNLSLSHRVHWILRNHPRLHRRRAPWMSFAVTGKEILLSSYLIALKLTNTHTHPSHLIVARLSITKCLIIWKVASRMFRCVLRALRLTWCHIKLLLLLVSRASAQLWHDFSTEYNLNSEHSYVWRHRTEIRYYY